MTTHRAVLAVVVIAGSAVGIAVTGWGGVLPRAGSLERIRRTGRIRIGYAVEAPYAFYNAEAELTGMDPELARWVVGRLDVSSTEWTCAEFGLLITGLESDRYDVVAAGMFITQSRAERVLFSEPTLNVSQGLLVREGNPRGLHSYEQAVEMDGVRIAVLTGSVEEKLFIELGMAASRLVLVPDALVGLVGVETGPADGLALSAPTVEWMVRRGRGRDVEAAEPFRQPRHPSAARMGYCAFAFGKEARGLRDAWNEALATFVGTREHLRMMSRFDFTEDNLPGGVSTEDILADDH